MNSRMKYVFLGGLVKLAGLVCFCLLRVGIFCLTAVSV